MDVEVAIAAGVHACIGNVERREDRNGFSVVPPPRPCGGFPQGGAVFRLGRFRRNQVQEVEERSVFGGQARPDHFRRDAGIVVADLFRGEFELGEHVFRLTGRYRKRSSGWMPTP